MMKKDSSVYGAGASNCLAMATASWGDVAVSKRECNDRKKSMVSRAALTKMTGRPALQAKATSAAVPALIPHTKITRLDRTLILFLASPTPVRIATATADDACVQ